MATKKRKAPCRKCAPFTVSPARNARGQFLAKRKRKR
jgi:hypothetical protein